jgi:predicted nucleotidyltransferase
MKEIILQKLKEIERDNDVRILFAIESGSRAWGFASPDSDYDVRFVYTHPEDFYLSIHDYKDVIELPVDEVLDIGGWDIRKALRFVGKTNAIIYEWYQSPIVYRKSTHLIDDLARIGNDYFSPRAGMHHYLSMTINTYESSLKGEQVKLKKYFYALRPILAAEWIARYGTVPPMEFTKLRPILEDKVVNAEIDELLKLKATADEKFVYAPNKIINEYLAERIAYLKTASEGLEKKERDPAILNQLFRTTIREAYGNK